MGDLLVLADDLSGAAESAAALRVRGSRRTGPVHVGFWPTDVPAGDTVLDLHSRHLSPADAERRIGEVLAAALGHTVIAKIDSLLRGNLVPVVRALPGPVVLAPALPVAGRTVVGGRVLVDGNPLATTTAWATEGRPAPGTVADVLPGLRTATVPLDVVRSAALAARIAETPPGTVVVCDAETDDDLDRIVTASPGCSLIGSAGLVAAVARALPANGDPGTTTTRPSHHLVVVVGTAEPTAQHQAEQLVQAGATAVDLPCADVLGGTVDRLAQAVATNPLTVVRLTGRAGGRDLSRALGRTVADAVGDADLVLTGGETARHVLDALHVPSLRYVTQIEHGAVRSETPDGRQIVTRPGSFGGPDSLLRIVRALNPDLLPPRPPEGLPMSSSTNPAIAVTMGDGAGVGPEVVVAALLHPSVVETSRSVVVGDAARLRQAADVLGVDVEVVPVQGVEDAVFEAGRINVIDLGLLPADLPWGELSPVAGDAAYHYVRVASEMAMRGEVQAICTAPLNKEALHLGGHVYPGHTELLAELTGTPEVSMMLSTPTLKVIHVTTHIGLIDAIAKIEPGLVERTVRRGHTALVAAGNPNPKIGVCAINPHAGEGGLFGYGEEAEKITPAIETLRADGIDAIGPLPADTLFFLAGRGDYDLVVAMYHDQGHGPVKVLGIEAGVNITVGLPVIRTSVDHGTAFDIAGTGKVDTRSMVEAMRQAIEVAPRPTVN
ncbi:4-hydroxythreonine-4-phosphate dehydrogenase [Kineococcus radiotolerans]|uniref:4-hydroxythreonine-4-phosphate dehydrogenase n=1 Tax=Kineococcus radiotolerans TaxID=131568 RepID=A0A7W4TR27_KINRA|nr:4-hydroxythreonine-4-phosphate dehydrogenase [Kineococcus radiotolerans]